MEAARFVAGSASAARGAARVLIVAVLAGLVGIGAHLAGGGSLPTTCMALFGVGCVAGPVAALAQALATRHRSTWRAFLALGGGQLGVELVLQANDRAVEGPLTTLAVHVLANLALGVMLVGSDRVRADLAMVLDHVLPPLVGLPGRPTPRHGCAVALDRAPAPRRWVVSPGAVRGPPAHLVLT